MEKRTLAMIKNSAIFMIGNFSSKLLIFFLLPLYTHYLTKEDYGTVDIYISILSVLYSFVSLQSMESVYRFIQDAKTHTDKCKTITNAFFTAFAGIGIFTIGMTVFGAVTGFNHTLLFIFYMAGNILHHFCQQTVRGMGKSVLYSVSGIVATVVYVSCNLLFIVVWHYGGISLIASYVINFIAVIAVILAKCNIFQYISLRYLDKAVLKQQLMFSLPLMPNAFCLWGFSSLGRFLLLFFYSASEVGLLAFATKFSQLLGVINSIFFMAWQQSAISEYHSADRDAYASRIFNRFLSFQLCAVAVLLPLIKFLTFTVMGESYREAWTYIPIFFVGILFNAYANFVSMGFFGAKQTGSVFFASFAAIIVYFVFGFFGAKYGYITGVGIAYALSQLTYFLIMKIRVGKYLNIRPNIREWIKPLFIAVISCIFYYSTGNLVLLAAATLLFGVLSLCFNYSAIKNLVFTVLRKNKKST